MPILHHVLGLPRHKVPTGVDEQHIFLRKKWYAEVLADQQGRESAAIDEEVRGEHLAGLRHQVRNVAALLRHDPNNVVDNMCDTELVDTVLLQKRPELTGIQVAAGFELQTFYLEAAQIT